MRGGELAQGLKELATKPDKLDGHGRGKELLSTNVIKEACKIPMSDFPQGESSLVTGSE